jgi:hypothetical protein
MLIHLLFFTLLCIVYYIIVTQSKSKYETKKKCTLREWQQIDKDISNLIVQASPLDGSDSMQPFPIGMGYKYKGQQLKGPHDQTVLFAVVDWTDQWRRPNGINRKRIIQTLENNGIQNKLTDTYFDDLPKYKFVVSPEGNGIDCHRHYEALIAGCIPIVEHNEDIEKKYQGCPILYTKDYTEITEVYLLQKYEEMLDTEYDFSKLMLDYYDEETIKEIKKCGNFWMKNFNNKEWY